MVSYPRYRECRDCGYEFDTESPEKVRRGGYINHCVDCMDASGFRDVVPYLAVQSGEGKASNITLLKFESEEERSGFHSMWKNNTGYYKGKSCQIGRGLVSSAGYNFQQVSENRVNPNHKGRE